MAIKASRLKVISFFVLISSSWFLLCCESREKLMRVVSEYRMDYDILNAI